MIFEGIEPTFQTYQVCTLTVKLKNRERSSPKDLDLMVVIAFKANALKVFANKIILTRMERIELSSNGLEPLILPLNYTLLKLTLLV